MKLRSIHTDSGRPEQLVGLFECPDCGHERRLPLGLVGQPG
jgi:transcription elongation factor Elf1